MPKPTERERVKRENDQVTRAQKPYEAWEKQWSCDLLERYYYGEQWQGEEDEQLAKRKYVINLFYPSVNISKGSMLFGLPKYKVEPRISRIDDPLSDAEARAKLQEQTLNTFVSDPDLGFSQEVGLAILDSQFRFGMVQVGYTADFIDNPNADRPMLRETGQTGEDGKQILEPMTDSAGNAVKEPKATLVSEDLYLKWVSACQVRMPSNSKNRTSSNDWVGYYEWHHVSDVQANPRYKNTSGLTSKGRIKNDNPSPEDAEKHAGMIKVWFKWNLRGRKKYVFEDGGEKFFLEESFTFLPLAGLKFDEILGQWYPLPPTYNWAHPQNELNDSRETDRIHRQRAKRRYLRKAGAFTNEEEWDKLCEGDDMVSVEVAGDTTTAVFPVPDAPLDASFHAAIPQAIDDFIRVSGISGESQQIADSDTATQANLIALAGRVRESGRRMQVMYWLSEIGRLILLTIKENMALPFWIKKNVDPYSPMAGQEAQEIKMLWEQITGDQLGDLDNDISVELTSMSPVVQETERQNWLTFLGIVTNPQLGAVLASSPTLLRKTAGLFDIHSEREIQEVSQAMQAAAMMAAQAAAAQAGVGGGGAAPGPTPSNGQIAGQLEGQLPVEVSQGVQ